MVTFDKLKLVASIDAIEVIDEDKFQKEVKSGRPVSLRYFQEVPFLLLVKVDFLRHEVVVEFCGKVEVRYDVERDGFCERKILFKIVFKQFFQ